MAGLAGGAVVPASSDNRRWSGRWRLTRSSMSSRPPSSPAGARAATGSRPPSAAQVPARPRRCASPLTPGADAGYRVIGAAVKGEAARQLAVDAGIVADTVALLLTHARRGTRILDQNTVLIVDEASTVGDRDLAELIGLAETTGATIRFIGDPAQHGAVPTGGCFEHLARSLDVVTLDTVYRLTDPGERHRADLIRNSRATQAISELCESGQLVLTPSETDTYAIVLERWYQARRSGAAHPVVHGRNRQRRELNHLAQQLLIEDGDVDATRSVTRRDGRRLCVGDEVMARHGDRSIHPPGDPEAWMRNGTTGRIINVNPGATDDGDTIELDTVGGALTVPRRVFDRPGGGLDLRTRSPRTPCRVRPAISPRRSPPAPRAAASCTST